MSLTPRRRPTGRRSPRLIASALPALVDTLTDTWAYVALPVGLAAIAMRYSRALHAERQRGDRAERRAQHLLAAQERDRLRLARALHDGPVQDLLALEMTAGVSAHLSGLSPDPTLDVTQVVRELRAVSEEMRPPALDAFGVAAAIRAHIERYRGRYPGISVALNLDDNALTPQTRLALFRIACEALENAALHGRPLRIDVDLSVTDTQAVLSVRDDGDGFEVPPDLASFAYSGRYGLLSMLVHAHAVGADLSVESTFGRTALRVAVPSGGQT